MDNEGVKEGREESEYDACRNSRFRVLDRCLQPRFVLAKVRSNDEVSGHAGGDAVEKAHQIYLLPFVWYHLLGYVRSVSWVYTFAFRRFFRCSGLKFLLHDRYKVMQCWSQFAQDGFCHDAAIHRKLQHRIFAHEILDNYRSVENPVRWVRLHFQYHVL